MSSVVDLGGEPGYGFLVVVLDCLVEFGCGHVAPGPVFPPGRDVLVGPHLGLGPLARGQFDERRVVDGDHLLLLDRAVEGGAQGGPDALLGRRADDAPALHRGPLLRVAGGPGGADELVVGVDRVEHRRDVHHPQPVDWQMPEVRLQVQTHVRLVGTAGALADRASAGQPLVQPFADRHRRVDRLPGGVAAAHLVVVGQRGPVLERLLDRGQQVAAGLVATRTRLRDGQQPVDPLPESFGLGLGGVAAALHHLARRAVHRGHVQPEVPLAVPGVPGAVLAVQRLAPGAEFAADGVAAAAAFVR